VVTLTAGGRAPVKPVAVPKASPVVRWHAALERLLPLAVEYGRIDELYQKRKAWCANNWAHDLIREREQAAHFTFVERNDVVRRMMDVAEGMSRIQGEMSGEQIDGLGALLGAALTPYASHRLALTAARLQSTDVFAIVATWLMDEDAEETCNSRS
jgi:hypothetical protein